MAKENDITLAASQQLQPLEHIENLILVIRGRQVMLDRDLARLYGVETKRLNQQVQRNLERFPEDFMFQLTKEEAEVSRTQFATLDNDYTNLRSQNATSNEDSSRSQFATLNGRGQNIKYLPYAFTENGIAMLSSVLRSPMAIATNIQIMRAFTAMRHFIASNAQVFQRLEIMEHNQLALNAHQEEISSHLAENDKKFEEVFRRLDDGSVQPTQRIFYDGEIFERFFDRGMVVGLQTLATQPVKKGGCYDGFTICGNTDYIDGSHFTLHAGKPEKQKPPGRRCQMGHVFCDGAHDRQYYCCQRVQ